MRDTGSFSFQGLTRMFGKENEGIMNNAKCTWPHIIPLVGRIKDWKTENEAVGWEEGGRG